MTERLVSNWNSVVNPEDTVWVLGDIMFKGDPKWFKALEDLHGQKHLLIGNHDNIDNSNVMRHFWSIHEYKEISIGKQRVVLMHYPINDWNRKSHGSFHLYGHIHGAVNGRPGGRSMDVGIDARPDNLMMPWSWNEIYDKLIVEPILSHGDHDEKTERQRS